ncbi:MAG: XRE family transcriptional regulator, partial [Clostridia bacterium]|nr:XRE family transcriptional regulator [Clostridia bacterium]
VAAAVGMTALFGLVAIGVALFIVTGIRTSRFNVWHTEGFETAYGVSGMVKEKRRAHEHAYTVCLTLGIVLCILAVLPLIVAGAMGVSDRILTVFLSMMFPIIGIGVYMIVRVGVVRGSFTFLLNEIDASPETRKKNKTEETIGSVYWCVAVAIYLTWSFLTNDWGRTWIVWPIAGVLFGAVTAIWRLVSGSRDDE